jgi:selenocysteine-specific elongation factor
VIVGTAGHIDHGKTALVRALTGVDTDRLPEEKRRGITIDLGFAPLELPGYGMAGVVDVPGHEAFVRTMLAGATGVDVALLVVAADEGVMPQTREHVAILELLGVRTGVVALTKRDLVDEEWLALVRADVEALLKETSLAGAPVVATSAVSGAGLEELRTRLVEAAAQSPRRRGEDLFRMPIDRVFTVKGIGTVVTGTIWSGTVRRDGAVRILPLERTVRARALQSHGHAVEVLGAGERAAIALVGIDHHDLARGTVLVADPAWRPTRVLRADVALLGDEPISLSPRARVRFHLGTSEVGARVVTTGGALAPGERKPARLVLDAPVVARAGDRFVLRGGSPLGTLGGGVVTDPLPSGRRVRPWPSLAGSAGERLTLLLREASASGLDPAELPLRLGLDRTATDALVSGLEGAAVVAGRVFDALAVEQAERAILTAVDSVHEAEPLEPGAPLQAVRGTVAASHALADLAVSRLTARGALESSAGVLRRAGWTPRLGEAQRATRDAIRVALEAADAEPPSVGELASRHGAEVPALLRLLERDGSVVAVESDRYFAANALERLVERLRVGLPAGRVFSPAEVREVLGVSRKFLIPLLEHWDRQGVTERRPEGRVVRFVTSGRPNW